MGARQGWGRSCEPQRGHSDFFLPSFHLSYSTKKPVSFIIHLNFLIVVWDTINIACVSFAWASDVLLFHIPVVVVAVLFNRCRGSGGEENSNNKNNKCNTTITITTTIAKTRTSITKNNSNDNNKKKNNYYNKIRTTITKITPAAKKQQQQQQQ